MTILFWGKISSEDHRALPRCTSKDSGRRASILPLRFPVHFFRSACSASTRGYKDYLFP